MHRFHMMIWCVNACVCMCFCVFVCVYLCVCGWVRVIEAGHHAAALSQLPGAAYYDHSCHSSSASNWPHLFTVLRFAVRCVLSVLCLVVWRAQTPPPHSPPPYLVHVVSKVHQLDDVVHMAARVACPTVAGDPTGGRHSVCVVCLNS